MTLLPWRLHKGKDMSPLSISELIDEYHQSLVASPFDEERWRSVAQALRKFVVQQSQDSTVYLAWLGRHSLSLFEPRTQAADTQELMKLLQALQELDWLAQAEQRKTGDRRRSG
ncbi:hypothetical protein [Salinibius halmophilus]|uniref:hypothetical protein n=1 Tax=Salinibius halmophilus TaxID=1853216 RepID=UPI000E674E1C|nr:hypothetical protein [Salinibius halmophilus]